MIPIPQLQTERLVLRPFVPDDGPAVEQLAGVREVADTTLSIPHPYPPGAGVVWIATHAGAWTRGVGLTLAICNAADDGALIGAIGLELNKTHRHAEIGYWMGRPWWGCGYATEAARALTTYGLGELDLRRIQGRHFIRNPASGRVLLKIGMQLEGVNRDAFIRWGRFEDVAVYAILQDG